MLSALLNKTFPTFILFRFRQTGQIIDIRAMINDATRMNAEEGVDSTVS